MNIRTVPITSLLLGESVFPAGFTFGVSTSSYQVEGNHSSTLKSLSNFKIILFESGGWLDGGKGLSIWDAYSHSPGQVNA